jgi:hypothetical protein
LLEFVVSMRSAAPSLDSCRQGASPSRLDGFVITRFARDLATRINATLCPF